MVAVYGLLADPSQVGTQFTAVKPLLPPEAYNLINDQMRGLASGRHAVLGAGAIVGVLVSAWSATKGTKSLIVGLNLVYEEREQRGFLKFNLVAYGLTLGLLLLSVIVIALLVAVPLVLGFFGLGGLAGGLIRLLRWLVLAAVVLTALAVLYRYGPCRSRARWQWVSWGSVAAVALWLAASGLFSIYVTSFANYNVTYGSVGAVVVLLMWLFISAWAVLLGALLNAETERQTGRDSTLGPELPRGMRGAYVADHLPD